MALVSYARHQFPPDIIQHAVWLYLRFSLSYRDREDLLAGPGGCFLRDGPALSRVRKSGLSGFAKKLCENKGI